MPGESKLPKPPLERPSAAIFAMKSAIKGFEAVRLTADQDDKDFMADLGRLVAWIDHLEGRDDVPGPVN